MKREFRTMAGVFFILMLVSGAQAASVVLDRTQFMCEAEPELFSVKRVERGYFEPRTANLGFQAPSDAPDPIIPVGKQILREALSGSGMFNFRTDRRAFSAGVTEAGRDSSVFSISRLLDLSQLRLKVSDEPIPTVALLILVGLVAIIALKGRRR